MARKDKRRKTTPPGPAPTVEQRSTASPASGETAEQRRARQKKEWEDEKRRKEMKGKVRLPVIGTTTVGALVGATTSIVVVVGAIVGVFLLVSGGDTSSGSDATPTPDSRVAGEPIAATIETIADDDGVNIAPRFEPNTLAARSGEVVEIKLTNNGASAHNINVSGVDKEFGTSDDFAMPSLQPGETGSLLLKLNQAGTYPFRCDLHPQQQLGQLVLS